MNYPQTITPHNRGEIIEFIQNLADGSHVIDIMEEKEYRNLDQNSKSHAVYADIASQTHQGPEEVKAYCKYIIGLPIMVRDEVNRVTKIFTPLAEAIQSLSFEMKLKVIAANDMTSKMTKRQKAEYIDSVIRHYEDNGVNLREV